MKGYIEITQDGIGRISRSKIPEGVEGLFTEKIETCTIILIVSMKGISLIHNTGKILVANIVNEFHWHETILFWTVAYNPKFYPEKNKSNDLALKLAYFIDEIENITGPNAHLKERDSNTMRLYETIFGFVTLSFKGRIETETKPHLIKSFEMKGFRHDINTLNNYFLNEDEFIPADIQFDQDKFTPLPQLFKTAEEVNDMAKLPRFKAFELNDFALQTYHKIAYELKKLRNPPQLNIAEILAKLRDPMADTTGVDSNEEKPILEHEEYSDGSENSNRVEDFLF